jgi:hypothetical protein
MMMKFVRIQPSRTVVILRMLVLYSLDALWRCSYQKLEIIPKMHHVYLIKMANSWIHIIQSTIEDLSRMD